MFTNEAGRLKALRQYRILDTKPEQAFDDLTLIASQICGVPIALISLVDEDRQWFKSRVGVEVQETTRSVSFCAHAIHQQGIFTVADALNDARFRDNPLVQGDPTSVSMRGPRSQRRMATRSERSASSIMSRASSPTIRTMHSWRSSDRWQRNSNCAATSKSCGLLSKVSTRSAL